MSNLNDPRYRAAMEANRKLMEENGEKPRSEGMSVLDELANSSGFYSLEELLKAFENVNPVSESQQKVLDAMRTQVTNIILIFGPGHGHTMQLTGTPADEIMWQDSLEPVHYADDASPADMLRDSRRGMHRYRLNDEMESSQMEEVAIYTHHEKCCEERMPVTRNTSRPDHYRDMRFRGY